MRKVRGRGKKDKFRFPCAEKNLKNRTLPVKKDVSDLKGEDNSIQQENLANVYDTSDNNEPRPDQENEDRPITSNTCMAPIVDSEQTQVNNC